MPATGPTRPLPIADLDELRTALGGQDERERFVIEMRYGLADGHQRSLAWIGRRLQLSAERVRQLEAQALERLGSGEREPVPRPIGHSEPPRSFEPARGPARQRFLRPWTLLLLWLEPAHGANLKERLEALGMPAADYRFLRRLEAEGVLRSRWAPGEGVGPDRRIYSLTDAGVEELERDAEALANVADTLAAFLDRRGRKPAA